MSSNVVHRRLTYHTYRLSSIVPYLMASHMVYVTVLQPTSTAAQPDGLVLATVFYILELVDRIVTVPNPKARASNHLSDASLGCAARYSQIAKSYCVLAGAWLLSALLLGPLASSRRLAVSCVFKAAADSFDPAASGDASAPLVSSSICRRSQAAACCSAERDGVSTGAASASFTAGSGRLRGPCCSALASARLMRVCTRRRSSMCVSGVPSCSREPGGACEYAFTLAAARRAAESVAGGSF